MTDRFIGCEQCHSRYAALNTQHANGTNDADTSSALVIFDPNRNPFGAWQNDTGAQTGSCANTYCHGATDGVTTVANEPDWYTSAVPLACTDCHTLNGGWLDPEDRDQSVSGNRGLHKIHLGNSIPCLVCHNTYTQWPLYQTHVDFKDLNFPASGTEADNRLRDDLIVFDDRVSSIPSVPDSFWSGAIGGWLGGCGGSLCHYPMTEIHDPGMVDYTDPTLGPLSGWYNR